jgi:hypothetical protein
MGNECDAMKSLGPVRFAQELTAEFEALRRDPAAWAAYMADAEVAVGDGIAPG